MAKRKKKTPKKEYNAKKDARDYLRKAVDALKHEIDNGKGIARIQAIQTLMKLAEVESIVESEAPTDIKFVEITTDPAGKIIPMQRTG